MVDTAEISAAEPDLVPDALNNKPKRTRPEGNDTRITGNRAFAVWGIVGYLLTTTTLLLASRRASDGHLVYLIDDPAIHFSIARTLAESGTWGVVPGQFQSASSSPLWTATLALIWRVLSEKTIWAPIVINVLASIFIIVLIGKNQDVLRPSRQRPMDGFAAVGAVVAMLFLPALTLLGMEHVVHTALVLSIIVVCKKSWNRRRAWPGPLLLVLLGVGSLVRFETAFVAWGLAIAVVACADHLAIGTRMKRSGLILAASGVPIAAFAALNRRAGQGWLPNSVLAKGQGISKSSETGISVTGIASQMTKDPLLAVLFLACLAIVIIGWRKHATVAFALAFSVASFLHFTFAQVGWFDRYQAYLVAYGLFVLLLVGSEARLGDLLAENQARSFRAALIAVLLLTLCVTKITLTTEVPRGVADTYQQRFQAGQFLERYYRDEPIATGELGYISFFHRGPITDFYGLGDFEVLQMRRRYGQKPPAAAWAHLAAKRGFDVAAVYPLTIFLDTPNDWILVGTWTMPRAPFTAFDNTFQFWATTPEAVAPLAQHLRSFAPSLPRGVQTNIDPFAQQRADLMLTRSGS